MAIILVALLSFSNYPLNPTDQDTVSAMNLHVTAGIASQSAMISAGPEFTLKYEYLFNHPFIFRSSLEYMHGKIDAVNYPYSTVDRQSISTEVIYYRGTKKITAYLGLGIVYSIGNLNIIDNSYFDNRDNGNPTETNFSDAFGYRFLMGLRFKHRYSLEVVITEISPSFVYFYDTGLESYSEEEVEFRANYVKVSLGYLFHLK